MKKLYEDNLTGMSKNIFDRCRDIREIEKRRTYLRLKRWLFMNRIMEYKTRRSIINSQRIEALGSKSFFIPNDDNISYRDIVDPNLKNSPFYQLVGLFTVKTISPEYALKFSTTNPAKEIFSHLEINQEKLNEIKAQLKENPKKFLEVWDSIYDKEAELEFDELEEKSFREYEKIYRMRHEGHSTLDFSVSSNHDDFGLAVRIIYCPLWPTNVAQLEDVFSVLKVVQDWHLEYQNGPLVVVDK